MLWWPMPRLPQLVLSWTDDVTIMTSPAEKFLCIFKIKFPTKRIFRIFHILRINGTAPFCNLFIERPSYMKIFHRDKQCRDAEATRNNTVDQITWTGRSVRMKKVSIIKKKLIFKANNIDFVLCQKFKRLNTAQNCFNSQHHNDCQMEILQIRTYATAAN